MEALVCNYDVPKVIEFSKKILENEQLSLAL